ncbi:hypothetical protein BOX15_Mlig027370g2 [Macrostomum lignano]|uniref:Protein kinase domain-containing protein n=1 Tax=Macrostomum lignano TaxID=282301 RepID=A0A267GMC3_9PLAT|nr:hypothetical protein BOX15_Mlig027370g2 [Macrostomum lignano]
MLEATSSEEKTTGVVDDEEEKRKMLSIFRDESGKNDDWNKKYIHSSLFLLGCGAYGSVFQVTTRLYTQSKQKIAKDRYIYHPDFLATIASQKRIKVEQQDKMKDRLRDDRLLDIVAVKYEILEQSHLEDGATRFFLFLRREFLIMDTIWRKYPRLLVGFPMVFDFGYIGDKLQYGVNPKYKNIFTYLNMQGEEVKFFADTHNRNLEGVTKISFMTMELLGPSIDDFRNYFEPWYSDNKLKTFFQVRTVFRIADQFLCRLYVLHRSGFVHHDLKPDNIAVGNGRAMNTVYLLDFGFSKQIGNDCASEWMGSRKFIAVDTFLNEKPNYAQDIESWFYIVFTLLYDALPWSEEFIGPLVGENAEESAKWNLVNNMKKTWWGEPSEAESLYSMMDTIAKIHSYEVPDIRNIIDQLHRKTRDLRGTLRQMNDAQTMNSELANINSNVSKGYMSIRKVLLQIFDLPGIWKNPHIGDSELRAYMETRQDKNYPTYTWDRQNFRWEWDRNHERMLSLKPGPDAAGISETQSIALAFSKVSEQLGRRESHDNSRSSATAAMAEAPAPVVSAVPKDDAQEPVVMDTPETNSNISPGAKHLKHLLSTLHNTSLDPGLRQRARQALMIGADSGWGKRARPDEISYVYDRRRDSLVPKNSGRRHIEPGRGSMRQSYGSGIFKVSNAAGRGEVNSLERMLLNNRHNQDVSTQLDTVWRSALPRVLTRKSSKSVAPQSAAEAAKLSKSRASTRRRRLSSGGVMSAHRKASKRRD